MLHLARDYELILYDQRGGGQSRAENNAPVTWHDHVADLAAICHENDISSPSLVGYSWGGMLALLYAVVALDDQMFQKPARLLLMCPAPITSAYRAEFEANLRNRGNAPEILEERRKVMESDLRDRDPEAYRQRIFELGVAGYFSDPANAVNLTPFRVVGRVQQSTWESLGTYDLRPEIERLRVTARIVHGRDDPIPPASSIDVARALQANLVLLDRCGHVPYVERPQELWEATDQFLASTDAAASE